MAARNHISDEGGPTGDLRQMVLLSLGYGLLLVPVLLIRGDTLALLGQMLDRAAVRLTDYLVADWWYIAAACIAIIPLGVRRFARRLSVALLLLPLCALFMGAFNLFKTSIPILVPFWADPWLADLDEALFGRQPWQLATTLTALVSTDTVASFYNRCWILPAMFLPSVLALVDGDAARRARYMRLYFFVWAIVGSILAITFSSVGPIYYDLAFGGDRFSEQVAAIQAWAGQHSWLPRLHDWLWQGYLSGAQLPGTGISAFPSVHVAMATVFALYLSERSRRLVPLAVLQLLAFLVGSVVLGWHYAVDGLASMLVVAAAWHLDRLRSGRPVAASPAVVQLP